jgi:hypothetical protein
VYPPGRLNKDVRLGGMMQVEDQYSDVLQNIEFAIVAVFREHPAMTDYDVMRTLETLIDSYKAEKTGRPPRELNLSEVEEVLREGVRIMCQWRLGRETFLGEAPKKGHMPPEILSLDEIVVCLKRILKSVKKWNRSGGRQGYLEFIIRYVE